MCKCVTACVHMSACVVVCVCGYFTVFSFLYFCCSIVSMAQMLSVMLYSRRFFPFYTYNILAGVDPEGRACVSNCLAFNCPYSGQWCVLKAHPVLLAITYSETSLIQHSVGPEDNVRLGGCRFMECLLPYFSTVTVTHWMVNSEGMSNCWVAD